MRDIKFRAWDKVLGMKVVIEMAGNGSWFKVDHDGVSEYTLSDVPVMQYTGLKDKNGVEIYEGDIVKDNIFGLYTVFFSYGGFKLIGVNELSNQLALMDSHSNWYEAIGNIYENPELLEANQ